MPQDAFTLKYLSQELNEIFKQGKINKIIQPNADEVIFTVYTGKSTKKLHLNVNPSCTRIGLTDKDVESPVSAPNFCMLLRKHLLNATINEISLVGYDRIIKIDLSASNEYFDSGKKVLYVELMGRYSNVILTENGKILGGNRGVNMFDNGVRPLIVGMPYVLPPTQNKKEPTDTSLIEVFKGYNGQELAPYICENVQGFAIATANEFAKYFEKNKNDDALIFEELFRLLNEFCYKIEPNPSILVDSASVIDFSVFPYEAKKGENIIKSSLVLAEKDYYESKIEDKKIKEIAQRLNSIISSALKKAKKKLSQILSKEKSASDCNENQIKGELILANIYLIKTGQKSVVVNNYYDGKDIEILLDERLTPSQNAESYFKKYAKQKRTLSAIVPQKNIAINEVEYLSSVAVELELCESYLDYCLLLDELKEYGLVKEQNKGKKRTEKSLEFREYLVDGFRVKVGRNNAENDRLTGSSKPDNLWLHAKDFHSSHVIIETEGKPVPERVIVIASEICAYYSKGREGGKTEIVYTLKKHVKKPPKSPLGFCVYDNFKSITVNPLQHVEFLKSI